MRATGRWFTILAMATAGLPAASQPAADAAAGTPPAISANEPTTLPPVRAGAGEEALPPQTSKTVITGTELRQVAGSAGDPMKSLQALPGVAVGNDASSEPAVRGSRPSDNAYYVDFLPVGYLFHVGGLVSVIHGDLVRQFDLYSSAFGPEYGDVTGAVLDVSLRDPRTDRVGGQVSISLLGADFLVEGPVSDTQSFYFAARRSYFDLVLDTIDDEDSGVIISVPDYYDYQAKYIWKLGENHRLSLHATGAGDHLDFIVPAGSALAQKEPALEGNGNDDRSYGTQALVWDAELGNDTWNKFALGQTQERNRSHIGTALDLDVDSRSTFLREHLGFQAGAAHRVTLGGDLTRVNADYDINGRKINCTEYEPECDITSAPLVHAIGTIRADIQNYFVKDRWQFADAWALTSGLHHTRESYLDRTYTEPRFGLEWNWSPRTTFSAAWGRYNQFPDKNQVIDDLGNPGLWHLRATHTAFGVTQKLDNGWSWRTEAYYKKFSEMVVGDPTLNYINGATGYARGIELLLKKDPIARWSGWLSLSLSESRRRNQVTGAEFPFDYDQPVIINLVTTYKLSERWRLGGKWSYHTGQPDTPIVDTNVDPGTGRIRPEYGPINSDRLPSYHRLDLRVDYVASPKWRFFGELINAYNRQNVSGYSYSVDYRSREPVTQLPLLVSFGVTASF